MTPFPDYYIGCITRIDTSFDGKQFIWYWAKREDVVVEVIGAPTEVYSGEFPARPIAVTPCPYPTDTLPTL